MKQFLHDMVHMTEVEKLINYWWVWLVFVILSFSLLYWINKKSPKN
jgi:hypothetical protein